MLAKAANNFDHAPDGINIKHVKKGDIIEVNPDSVDGMVDADQIKDPEGKDYSKELAKKTTTKGDDDGDGEKSVGKMNKAELVAHAKATYDVDLEGTKDEMLAKIAELAAANGEGEGE